MDFVSVKVIEDSVSPDNLRLTTLQLKYPRYIHAEFMTHRVFSRNASSSRAIPVAKLAAAATENMVYPARWGKNQAGMQPSEENLSPEDADKAKKIWDKMAAVCANGAQQLSELGLHKQWANRPLEWFGMISVVVSATDWENFHHVRSHSAAQDEVRQLSDKIKEVRAESVPKGLMRDEWHLPYVSEEERENYFLTDCIKISSARCARVSYNKHDGTSSSVEDDVSLYERLVGSYPQHMSPVEHQATPMPGRWGNFHGWKQHRQFLEEEGLV